MNGYRYGFNGKENDNEVKGEGDQQDYGMRVYDPRLGKFLSVDPITAKYPELTPYQFASNRPIDGIDLDGLEHLYFQLNWDDKNKKPALVLTRKEDVRYEWMTGRNEPYPLGYFVAYKGKEYRFFEGGRPPYLPGNSIENFNTWVSNYSAYKGADGKVQDFSEVFGSNEDWRHGMGDEMLNELTEALVTIAVSRELNKAESKGRTTQIRGEEYEKFLVRYLGGEPNFKVGGRDFDGKYLDGKIWYEAKSGDFFKNYDLNKFKSDMGSRLKIATENGVRYELWSEKEIPKEAKDYLNNKGIRFYEGISRAPLSIKDL